MSTPTPPPDRDSSSSGRGGGARLPHAAAPPKPQRPARTTTSILYPKPSRESILTAAVAIGCVIVIKFAVAFVQLIGNAIDYSPTSYANGFLASPIGLFLGSLVLYPFFYYLAAFAALALFFPLLRQTSLPTVLGRAVAAGVVATIVLALVGIVTGIRIGVTTGDWIAVALYVLFIPLSAGIQLTAILVAGAVVAWLWLGRQGPLSSKGAAAGTAAVSSQPSGSEAAPGSPPGSPTTGGDGSVAVNPGPSPSAEPRDPSSRARTAATPNPAPRVDPVTDLSRYAPPSATSAAPGSQPPASRGPVSPKEPPNGDD